MYVRRKKSSFLSKAASHVWKRIYRSWTISIERNNRRWQRRTPMDNRISSETGPNGFLFAKKSFNLKSACGPDVARETFCQHSGVGHFIFVVSFLSSFYFSLLLFFFSDNWFQKGRNNLIIFNEQQPNGNDFSSILQFISCFVLFFVFSFIYYYLFLPLFYYLFFYISSYFFFLSIFILLIFHLLLLLFIYLYVNYVGTIYLFFTIFNSFHLFNN